MWTRTDPRHIHSQIDVNIERDRPQILGYLTSIDNSLAILRPDVASKWDYVKNQDLTPDMFTVSSNVNRLVEMSSIVDANGNVVINSNDAKRAL